MNNKADFFFFVIIILSKSIFSILSVYPIGTPVAAKMCERDLS